MNALNLTRLVLRRVLMMGLLFESLTIHPIYDLYQTFGQKITYTEISLFQCLVYAFELIILDGILISHKKKKKKCGASKSYLLIGYGHWFAKYNSWLSNYLHYNDYSFSSCLLITIAIINLYPKKKSSTIKAAYFFFFIIWFSYMPLL